MPDLRYFTDAGRQRWAEWLDALRGNPALPLPQEMLTDAAMTLKAPGNAQAREQRFDSKFELAETLAPAISQVEAERFPADRWPGLWDWLAAFYFDSICPQAPNGQRKLRDQVWYVLNNDYRRRYRHRIFGPVDLVRRLGAPACLLIHGAPSTLTDWEEQTASRYPIKGNPEVAKALHKLYWDTHAKKPKSGAAPNTKKPGTLRRFSDLLLQLERTYDLLCTNHEGMLNLLPKEFDRFKVA